MGLMMISGHPVAEFPPPGRPLPVAHTNGGDAGEPGYIPIELFNMSNVSGVPVKAPYS